MAGLNPPVCFSCGRGMDKYYRLKAALEDDGYSEADILDSMSKLGICCKRMVISAYEESEENLDIIAATQPESYYVTPETNSNKKTKSPIKELQRLQKKSVYTSKVIPFKHLCAKGANCRPLKIYNGVLTRIQTEILDTSNNQVTPTLVNNSNEELKPVKWNSRKIILALMTFFLDVLVLYPDDEQRLLYVTKESEEEDYDHIGILLLLSEFFHDLTIQVYGVEDTENELEELVSSKRIIMNKETFSGKIADEIKDDIDYVFIFYPANTIKSDISVLNRQERYFKAIQPLGGLLSFTTPDDTQDETKALPEIKSKKAESTFEYLRGKLLFPIWSGPTSDYTWLKLSRDLTSLTETGDRTTEYDIENYNTRLKAHDSNDKLAAWQHQYIDEDYGIDGCYDCTAECQILASYIEQYENKEYFLAPYKIQRVKELTTFISHHLNGGRYKLSNPPSSSS